MTQDTTIRFLDALFPEWPAEVFAEVRAFKDGKVKRRWVRSTTELVDIANQLKATHDVYYGVCPRRGRSGKKENIAYVAALWADLDKPLDEVRRILANFPLPPSGIVSSGYGVHVYWLLREVYSIGEPDDVTYVEARTRGLAHRLDADSCWDLSRILRVPGSVNHKNGQTRPVEIVEFHPERRYNLSEFDECALDAEPIEVVEFRGHTPDAEQALRKAEANDLPVRTWRLITEGHSDDADRSREDFGVICDLVRANLTNDEIRAVFAHFSVGTKYRERGEGDRYLALTIAKAWAETEKDETPSDEPSMGKDGQARRAALQRAKETVARWLLLDDDHIVDVVLAVPVANSAPGDPVWVIVVAASSGAKTELIRGLNRCPQVYALSSLTDRTFASGFGDPLQSSLLPKLKNGLTLTFKDFGSILSMRPDAKAEVLGQLREIYDGRYHKVFGTGRELDWEGRLGLLTASTPAIERHHGVIGELGERFLWYRLETPEDDREAIADVALEDSGQEKQMRDDIAQAFLDVIGDVNPDEVAAVSCGTEMKELIATAANLATWLRTPVARDYRDKTIDYQPLPEGPARMAKALLRLGKAIATVRGQDAIDEDVGRLLVKFALDSVPPKRLGAVRLLKQQSAWVRTRDVGLKLNLPTTTATYLLEDLDALHVVNKRVEGGEDDYSGNRPYEWHLRSKIAGLLGQLEPDEETGE